MGPSLQREGFVKGSIHGLAQRGKGNNQKNVSLQFLARLLQTMGHLIPMSAQDSPKIQVRLPIGGKNYCCMPQNEEEGLYQICLKLSYTKNVAKPFRFNTNI